MRHARKDTLESNFTFLFSEHEQWATAQCFMFIIGLFTRQYLNTKKSTVFFYGKRSAVNQFYLNFRSVHHNQKHKMSNKAGKPLLSNKTKAKVERETKSESVQKLLDLTPKKTRASKAKYDPKNEE